jgi:hypothetical protein
MGDREVSRSAEMLGISCYRLAPTVARKGSGSIGSTMPNVLSSPLGDFHWTNSCPILGVITMLPAPPERAVIMDKNKLEELRDYYDTTDTAGSVASATWDERVVGPDEVMVSTSIRLPRWLHTLAEHIDPRPRRHPQDVLGASEGPLPARGGRARGDRGDFAVRDRGRQARQRPDRAH